MSAATFQPREAQRTQPVSVLAAAKCFSGTEISTGRIVDRAALAEAVQIDVSRLCVAHTEWIDEALRARRQ